MPVQSTYSENMSAGRAGAIVDMSLSRIESRTAEVAMNFGAAVAQGSVSDMGGKVPASTAVTLGVAVRDRGAGLTNINGYAAGESMAVMTKGKIWVTASVAVDPDDPVFVVPTTGVFAKTSVSSAVQIPNARWASTAGIGELAVLELR